MTYKVALIASAIQSWIQYLQSAYEITNDMSALDQIKMYESVCNYLTQNYPLDKEIELSRVPRISNCMLHKLIERYELIKTRS